MIKSTSSIKNPAVFNFESKDSGKFSFQFSVVDEKLRSNISVLDHFYVSGGSNLRKYANNKMIQCEAVELIANKEKYNVGDTGEVLLIAPFSPAYGVMTIDCEGVEQISSFVMKEDIEILNFVVKKEWIPGVSIKVHLDGSQYRTNQVGNVVKDAPKRPAYAQGTKKITVNLYCYFLLF